MTLLLPAPKVRFWARLFGVGKNELGPNASCKKKHNVMIGQIVIDANAALVVVTAVLAVFTAIYVWETHRLVEAQTDPLVYMDVEWRDVVQWQSDLKIYIKNIGKSPALDIEFTVKDDFQVFVPGVKEPLSFRQVWFVEHGVRGLAPDRDITLTWMTRKSVEQITKRVEVIYTYRNTRGKQIPAKFCLDFPAYIEMK